MRRIKKVVVYRLPNGVLFIPDKAAKVLDAGNTTIDTRPGANNTIPVIIKKYKEFKKYGKR